MPWNFESISSKTVIAVAINDCRIASGDSQLATKLSPWPSGSEPRHQCLIYEGSPSKQLPAIAAMIRRKLDEGYRCLYLNSRPMVAGVRSYLAAMGSDVESELARNRLVLSSEPVVSVGGDFDGVRMLEQLGHALDTALSDGYRGLWATGDMVWEFGSEKNYPKLLDYEYGLETLMGQRPELCGICQYHQDLLPDYVIRQARLVHPALFINETLSRVNPDYVPRASSNGKDSSLAV